MVPFSLGTGKEEISQLSSWVSVPNVKERPPPPPSLSVPNSAHLIPPQSISQPQLYWGQTLYPCGIL